MTKKDLINNPLIISDSESNSEIINKETPKSRVISSKLGRIVMKYGLLILTIIGANELIGQIDNTRPQDSIQFEKTNAIGTTATENNTTSSERDNRFYLESKNAQEAYSVNSDIDHILQKVVYHYEPSLIESGSVATDLNNVKTLSDNDTLTYPVEDVVIMYSWNLSQKGASSGMQPNGRMPALVNASLILTNSDIETKTHEGNGHPKGVGHIEGSPNSTQPSAFLTEIITNTGSGMSVTEQITPTIMADGSYGTGNGRTYMTVSPTKNTGLTANGGTGFFTRYPEGTNLKIETPAAQLDNINGNTSDIVAQFLLVDHPESLHSEYVAPPSTVILACDPMTGDIYVENQSDFNNVYINVIGTTLGTNEIYTCYLYDVNSPTSSVGSFSLNDTVNISDFGLVGVDSVNAKMSSFLSNGISTTASNNISTEIDTIAPSATASTISYNPTNDGSIEVTYNFNEPVTGLDNFNTDFNVSGPANITNLVQISPTEYVVTLSPTGNGNINLTLLGGACTDIAGNPNIANNVFNIEYDGLAPTVSINSPVYHTNLSSLSVGIILSEMPVNNLTVSNLTATNCGFANFAGSGQNYTFDILASSEGLFSVAIAANTFTDMAGNSNTMGAVKNFYYDITNPQIVLNSDTASYYLGQNGTATLSPDEIASITDNNPSETIDTGNPESVDCDDLGFGQGTISATDSSANSTMLNYIYEVLDTIKPTNTTIENILIDLQGNSTVSLDSELITGTDNCEVDLNSRIWSVSAFTTPGVYQVVSSISDMSGNLKTKESTITVGNTVGIDDLSEVLGVRIYPNPSKNVLNVKIEINEIETVKIFTLEGRLISVKGNVKAREILIDISKLAVGAYFVKIENETGLEIIKSFVKY